MTPPANDATAQAAEDARYYRGVLHELIDMGVDLARQAHAGGMEAGVDATIAFDRIARTVRRTISLARRLDEPVAAMTHRIAARRQIIRAVEGAIQRQTRDEPRDAADALEAELFDRLDGPEFDADLDHRPVAEIIAEISRDLGLAGSPGVNPWKRRTPDDVAALCARAVRPSASSSQAGERPERFFRIVAAPVNDG